MKSKPLFFFVLFLIGLFVFFKLDHILRSGVFALSDSVKNGFFDAKAWIVDVYQSHFDQAEMIADLKEQLQTFERLQIEKLELQAELKQLLEFYNLPPTSMSQIFPIRSISYVEMGNYNRVWLSDFEAQRLDKFYGLIVGGYVAGIARLDDRGYMVGYLNGDSLCSYGVFIGDSKALGVLRGEEGRAIIDYIPLGSRISVGDEVMTNGMDGIFFAGIPLGKITKIVEKSGYLSAQIGLYAKGYGLGYMWLLDRSSEK